MMLMNATNTTGRDQRVRYEFDAVWELTNLYNRDVYEEVPDTVVIGVFGTKDLLGFTSPSGSVTSSTSICPPAWISSLGTVTAMRWRLLSQTR
jgi:hypothetical protein